MNKKGMTIIELVVSFSLASVIALFLIEIVIFLKDTYAVNAVKSEIILKQSLISSRLNKLLNEKKIKSIDDNCGDYCLEITFTDESYSTINFDVPSNKVIIDDYIVDLPIGTKIDNVRFLIKNIASTQTENDSILQIKATLKNTILEDLVFNVGTIYPYNSKETALSITRVFTFSYSGSHQRFIVPKTGFYKVELWGASGGYSIANGVTQQISGKGGYTSGVVQLKQNETLYIYIGGKGSNAIKGSNVSGGYNGGGLGTWDGSDDEAAGGGGGATDVRYFENIDLNDSDLLWNSELGLNSRIMVAGGGGGSAWTTSGGNAGGLTGYTNNPSASAGTQTSGYAFGIGQNGSGTGDSDGVGGAGSGYYGGYASGATPVKESGAGGSSYISGHTGCVAITSSTSRTPKSGCTNGTIDVTCSYHYSGKIFTNTEIINGNSVMPNPDGGTEIGHTGNGYAIITYIGKSI